MLNLKTGGPRVLGGTRRHYVMVASQYNADLVQGLVDFTAKELMRLAPQSRVTLHQVPGAFEIPLVVQEVAARREDAADAIIALGVIIQGETDHAGHLGRTVTGILAQIALATRIPVIHAVLSCKNEEQAKVRCLDPQLNRGLEAARTAVAISNLLAQMRE